MQVVRHLLAWRWSLLQRIVCVNVKNLEGKIAWDILQGLTQVDNREMKVMLHRAGALTGSSLSTTTCSAKLRYLEIFRLMFAYELTTITDEMRNAFLVVAVLLLSVTYQGLLSPPGGVWQDDYKLVTTTASDATAYEAGTAIGLTKSPGFSVFLIFNTLTFLLSKTITYILLPYGLISGIFTMILAYLWLCYVESLIVITNCPYWMLIIGLFMVIIYMCLLQAFVIWTRRLMAYSKLEILQD